MNTAEKLIGMVLVSLLFCFWTFNLGIGWFGITFWIFVLICIGSCEEKRASEKPVVTDPEDYGNSEYQEFARAQYVVWSENEARKRREEQRYSDEMREKENARERDRQYDESVRASYSWNNNIPPTQHSGGPPGGCQ